GRGLALGGRDHSHWKDRHQCSLVGDCRGAATGAAANLSRCVRSGPGTGRACPPDRVSRLMLGSVVDGVDPDPVGIHIEIAAGGEFADRYRGGTLELLFFSDEAL